MRELIIDSFAGGGGASEGIRAALGRDPDIAINHDRYALAMHRINHPDTHHMVEDVWHVDPVGTCAGRPIGLFWMSPDCKHFSKAKGGKPREKAIRGLAWVGLRWAKSLPAWQRPRVVCLENVEEFQDWGPLLEDGKPCPIHKGAAFRAFVAGWQQLGYAVEWRQRRAWKSGAPTIRKRLYMIMRRDGEPIVWPEAYFGNPNDPADAARIKAGALKPWRTAADIIDFNLPCPSIFDTSEEIRRKLGIRANRPLAEATMARIAKGTMRYVVNSAKPFIVRVNHGESRGRRHRGLDEPTGTMTAHRGDALVTPFVTKFRTGATGQPMDEPLCTVTAHASDTHPGGAAPIGLVAPHLIRVDQTSGDPARKGVHPPDAPVTTISTAGSIALVAPILAGCGGRAAQSEPRPADAPIGTQTAKPDLCVVAPYLVPRYQERPGQEPRTRSVEQPVATQVPGGNEGVLTAVHLSRQFGASVGSDAAEPVGTITAGGAGKAAVVAAFLAQHNTERGAGIKPGSDAREPVSTVTSAGGQQTLVAAHLTHAYTSNTRGGEGDLEKPINTTLAGGNHAATVYAFLQKYYGNEIGGVSLQEPMHTDTAKDRMGLVTVTVEGETYVIVDIGMRMLTPRERFNAQGFRPDYVIDRGMLEDGTIISLTLEQQGRMCGNSVCPPEAEVLVRANYVPRDVEAPRPRRRADPDQSTFLIAAE